AWRRPLYDAGLIGHYDEFNVGYGNISIRLHGSDQFVISGTQTGHIPQTSAKHFTRVRKANIEDNTVHCVGPIQASSEALTHAALYSLSPKIAAVVHVHDRKLWQQHINRLPTTNAGVPYGTPDMAREFQRLWNSGDFSKVGIAVMAGHDEGLVSIGASLETATMRMLELSGRI
ncbi:MAG: class II aldolase/adducin family protein, partial [Woeseiaceae bacterium]|nr:class II aldolase/adducin family protein [Woeseiaceae bacterium]